MVLCKKIEVITMARRCVYCNRIITEDLKFVSQSVIDTMIEEGILDQDFEKDEPLPICRDCLDSFSD